VVATSQGSGTGATFTVTLPVRAVDPATASAESAANSNEAERISWREPERLLEHARVLVVDDDLDSLDLAREILETKGASVVTAAGSRQALDAFTKRGPFDVVLSDIGMPQMDGYALIAVLRAQPSWAGTKAIALTAYARTEDAEQALKAGFQEHLPKPIDAPALVRAVHRWAHETKTPD
jgi:CheY-like chemotaxis protein